METLNLPTIPARYAVVTSLASTAHTHLSMAGLVRGELASTFVQIKPTLSLPLHLLLDLNQWATL